MFKTIHIALASDDAYARFAGAVIVSILKHAASDEQIVIHLLDSGIREKNLNLLRSLEKYHIPSQIRIYQVNPENIFPEVPLPDYISRTAMVRLDLPRILPDLDRSIYLDSDVIVMDSLWKLWSTELPDSILAAGVPDFNTKLEQNVRIFDLSAQQYINSGVLIMELRKMREQNSTELFRQALRKYGKFIAQGDQDLLNAALRGKIAYLPLRWNLSGGFFKHKLEGPIRETVLTALASPGIIHYTSSRKPWSWKTSRHPLWEEYFHTIAGTGLACPVFHFLKKHILPRCRAIVPQPSEKESK